MKQSSKKANKYINNCIIWYYRKLSLYSSFVQYFAVQTAKTVKIA